MGFWSWLMGKKSGVAITDKIWLTKSARNRALCRDLQDHLSTAHVVIILAHFPATLAEIRQELSEIGIPYEGIANQISAKDANRLAGPQTDRRVRLGLVKQLRADSYPDRNVEEGGPIYILVAERHFIRKYDEVVSDFASTLNKRCQIAFYLSLDDPLLKHFAGEWVKEVLQRLGMNESDPVESPMLARRIAGAQKKFAGGVFTG
jgi:preprotein translocase subunit SecA